MILDILGNRIKKPITNEMFHYLAKYYIYNEKTYQIIRAEVFMKLDAGLCVDLFVQDIKSKSKFKKTITLKTLRERKVYENKPKLNSMKLLHRV